MAKRGQDARARTCGHKKVICYPFYWEGSLDTNKLQQSQNVSTNIFKSSQNPRDNPPATSSQPHKTETTTVSSAQDSTNSARQNLSSTINTSRSSTEGNNPKITDQGISSHTGKVNRADTVLRTNWDPLAARDLASLVCGTN